MSEEFDFSELRNYLQGQMDLCGEAGVFLDEPWTLVRKNPARPSAGIQPPARHEPPVANGAPDLVMSAPGSATPAVRPAMQAPVASINEPAVRPVRKVAAAYDSAETLSSFYDIVAKEAVYAGSPSIARYEGPEHPKLLLLFSAPQAGLSGNFLASPTGEMLVRLFASLNVEQNNIGVAYFYKSSVVRNIPPLLEAALRKMLTKELSFVNPEIMVTFGEPLFHQLFGKGMSFDENAGMDLSFNGTKTCSLVDAFAMTNDKQLKWLTWKVHIPRGTYFK